MSPSKAPDEIYLLFTHFYRFQSNYQYIFFFFLIKPETKFNSEHFGKFNLPTKKM